MEDIESMLMIVLAILIILVMVIFFKKHEGVDTVQGNATSSKMDMSIRVTLNRVSAQGLESDDGETISYTNIGSISKSQSTESRENMPCDYILKPFELLSVQCFYGYIGSIEKASFEENCIAGKNVPIGEYLIVSYDGLTCKAELFEPQKRKPFTAVCFRGYCMVRLRQGERIKLFGGNIIQADKVEKLCADTKVYTFKVGVHIEPGKYKISQRDCTKFAVYYIWNDMILDFNNPEDSDAIWDDETVDLTDGQYIYLENAVIKRENK